ncbi:MAG: glycosyltransferase, partial [Gemmatimonadota bacterium]
AGPAGRVLLQTDQTRVADYMRAADVYVLPLLEPNSSFADGVARAMSCGLAVVTTPVEGLSDVIRAGVNALTISPGDTAGLSTALLELLEHPAHRRRLGAAAAEGSRAFAADAILARYLAMFAEILPGDQSVRLGRPDPTLSENLHAVAPGR